MSGAVSTIGKFFNSTPGRIITGVATGGASEIGRAVAGTARRSGVDPGVSAAIGYAAGSRETGTQTLGAGTGPVSPKQAGGVVASAGSVQKTNEDAQRELDGSLAKPPAPLDQRAPIDPYAEEDASRRRARESALRTGSGKRRASERLTTPYLGA